MDLYKSEFEGGSHFYLWSDDADIWAGRIAKSKALEAELTK
jgi:hypothetical protein